MDVNVSKFSRKMAIDNEFGFYALSSSGRVFSLEISKQKSENR